MILHYVIVSVESNCLQSNVLHRVHLKLGDGETVYIHGEMTLI